ncbi:TnsA-like heteromeric transposase endonuclease subunit [Pseudofrankia sp. BMG5.37]|uniref:TnsA-like heteromeric transposase endonuclease subunit n=1 Tax=Pseudofrankia sp. BMG5.37 TaxID=3050035 RepID=UPI002894D1A5|nr:TnsA-like heteromeric transposase endonuclease subunit [Pseudofrankia sp. BMG5.37]MDT3444002.1 TnsA-like heteromeric transposase endonuclease subunit [Pseudofrankia sp. BMG5.37]
MCFPTMARQSEVEAPRLRLRRAAGTDEVDLGARAPVEFDGALPWRTFRWRRGQAHYSGLYWSAVTGAHVGYESRLELAWLLIADRDRRLRRIVSQPFQLVARVGGAERRHVPDFLAVREDGLVTVVDVKPRRRLVDDKVVFTFGWTGQVAAGQGWEFEVFSEPDPVVLANVRFLSGYRRGWQFDQGLLEAVVASVGPSVSFADAARAAGVVVGSGSAGRAYLLAALWSGRVEADLRAPLEPTTLVRAAA